MLGRKGTGGAGDAERGAERPDAAERGAEAADRSRRHEGQRA